VNKVETGSKLVDGAGKTMEEIVASVKHVTDIMQQISAASQEQSGGIEQVNSAVAQMDRITRQNAALVEEAASAAKSMEDQTANLAEMVAVFHLGAAFEEAKVKPAPRVVAAPVHAAAERPTRKPAPAANRPQKAAAAPVKPAPAHRPTNGSAADSAWREF
jgi:methyl-accepting chemotaxis protein